MRACSYAAPGVLVIVAVVAIAACEKAPAAKPEDPPAAKLTDPVPSAVTSATVTPSATTTAVAVSPDAGKPPSSGAPGAMAKTTVLRPASSHVAGKNYALDVASQGCRAGDDCTMTVKLSPDGAFHVNKEYPYKFLATPAPNLAYLGKSDANTFTRAAGDFTEQSEKAATMTVRFKPTAAGETHVSGKYKLSVCSAEQCQIEEAMVDLPVTVL